MSKSKIELGDIFEMLTPSGKYIYMQCVELPIDTKNELELVKIFYKVHDERTFDLDYIMGGGYFFNRFGVKAACRRKILEKVGNVKMPENFEAPKYYRTTNITDDAWQIIDAKTWKRETVVELSDEQKKLSPWGMLNDTLIIELLERGWTVENWTLNNMFIE